MRGAIVFLAPLAVVLASCALAETTDDSALLTQKGASQEVLTAFTEASKGPHQVSVATVVKLLEAKVPDDVIVDLLRHQPAAQPNSGQPAVETAKSGTQARESASGVVKVFTLKDGRVVNALNSVNDDNGYVVKTDKGRLVSFKKSDVASVRDVDQESGDNGVTAGGAQAGQQLDKNTMASPVYSAGAAAGSSTAAPTDNPGPNLGFSSESTADLHAGTGYFVGTPYFGRPWYGYYWLHHHHAYLYSYGARSYQWHSPYVHSPYLRSPYGVASYSKTNNSAHQPLSTYHRSLNTLSPQVQAYIHPGAFSHSSYGTTSYSKINNSTFQPSNTNNSTYHPSNTYHHSLNRLTPQVQSYIHPSTYSYTPRVNPPVAPPSTNILHSGNGWPATSFTYSRLR